ncbi:MAG: Hsp70 family protein, partial [Bryobacteraceae bacterium]
MSTFQIDFGESEDRVFGEREGRVIGIDLGTTNSLAAYTDESGQPAIIPGAGGGKLVPSIVSLSPSGDVLVGAPARDALITHPGRTVYSVKRLMGRGLEDVGEEIKLFPFRVAEGSESVIQLQLGERTLTPPQASAEILRQLKRNAEAHLGAEVTKAVITVPAYFN